MTSNGSSQSTAEIPIEEVGRQPLPGLAIPSDFAFSPDDRWVSYLYSPDRGLVRQLFAYDLATNRSFPLLETTGVQEEKLSLEERLRRERQRQLALGITSYAWAPKGSRILVPVPDGLAIQNDRPRRSAPSISASKGTWSSPWTTGAAPGGASPSRGRSSTTWERLRSGIR